MGGLPVFGWRWEQGTEFTPASGSSLFASASLPTHNHPSDTGVQPSPSLSHGVEHPTVFRQFYHLIIPLRLKGGLLMTMYGPLETQNFRHWALDFQDSMAPQRIGVWESAPNLILTKSRDEGEYPAGADWRVTTVAQDGDSLTVTLEATAKQYAGWYLDFDNDAGTDRSSGYTIRNC